VRTTLSIDDDMLDEVKTYAADRGISIGRAASDLIRRALSQPVPTLVENGLRVFARSAGAHLVSPDLIRRLDADQDLHKVR
jgi:negative regulator of replication initiation